MKANFLIEALEVCIKELDANREYWVNCHKHYLSGPNIKAMRTGIEALAKIRGIKENSPEYYALERNLRKSHKCIADQKELNAYRKARGETK